jgi:hypothetical protein
MGGCVDVHPHIAIATLTNAEIPQLITLRIPGIDLVAPLRLRAIESALAANLSRQLGS